MISLWITVALVVVVLFIWPGLVVAVRNAAHRRWETRKP